MILPLKEMNKINSDEIEKLIKIHYSGRNGWKKLLRELGSYKKTVVCLIEQNKDREFSSQYFINTYQTLEQVYDYWKERTENIYKNLDIKPIKK